MPAALTLDSLKQAMAGTAAAFAASPSCRPRRGVDNVFPPTYEGPAAPSRSGSYQAVTSRSSARSVNLEVGNRVRCVSSLETPHRIEDALLHDSLLNGRPFPSGPPIGEFFSRRYM